MPILQRDPGLPDATFGTWTDDDGNFMFYTLEPPNPQPAGKRHVSLRWSQKHSMGVPGFEDVPGHTDIEFHPGNDENDTLDCVLPGDKKGKVNGLDAVLNSRAVFVKFMNDQGCPDYHLDGNGKIVTSLNTEDAVNAFKAANPDACNFFIDIRDAA